MNQPARVVKDIWEIGPLMPAFRFRPPTARLAYHEGRDRRTGDLVEIILLRSPWCQDATFRREFLDGVEKVRPIDHPNVVRVLDVFEEEDLVGYVTDYQTGDSIYRQLLYSSTIFTEAEVVRIIRELAEGLEYAHARGVIFANIKPTNVGLGINGTARIFALPKCSQSFVSFLHTAWYVGHGVYHSPEFLCCEPVDERTDIYGLGITAYEMMVSSMPGTRSGNWGIDLHSIVTKEWPAPSEIVEDIDPALNNIIVRCLKKDRQERYSSIADVLRDLKQVKGKNACLISAARLMEIVTAVFPTPLAVLARGLVRDDHLLAQKDKLLNQVHGLINYLGFLAALSLKLTPADRLARPSLGHWVGVVDQALRSEEAGWPYSEFKKLLADCAEFRRNLNDLVHLRNQVSHGTIPEVGEFLFGWVSKTSGIVRQLYKSLLFLAQYALVSVEDMDYVNGQFRYHIRRLEGLKENTPTIEVTLPQPYSRGKVYFANGDFSQMVCLDPFVVLARCPQCAQTELFFYHSVQNHGILYETPDRGHRWSCLASAAQ